jgi:hypothetical protein
MLTPVRSTEQGKGLAPEVPEHGEDDVGVVEAEAGAYRPAVEALRPPHPVEVDRVGNDVHLGGGRRVLLEQLAGQPVPGTTMRRMRPNTQGLGHGVEAMVEPAKPVSHGPAPGRLLPQERALAEVDVRQAAERQVALDHLDQVVGIPSPSELEQVAERCHQVVGHEQQRLGTTRTRTQLMRSGQGLSNWTANTVKSWP